MFQRAEVQVATLPPLPSNFNLNKLQDDGFILSKADIQLAKPALDALQHSEIASKSQLKIAASVIKIENNLYAIGPVLGEGAFGKVKFLQNIATGEFKILKKQILDGDNESRNKRKSISKELADLEQKHLWEFGDKTAVPLSPRYSPRNSVHQHLIAMDLAEGISLEDLTDRELAQNDDNEGMFIVHPLLSPRQRLTISLNVLKAVADFMAKGFIYRDLKLGNLMVNTDGKVTLVDFGSVRKMNAEMFFEGNDFPGTPHLIAPENRKQFLAEGKAIHNEKSEVYALGIVLAQFFSLYDYNANEAIYEMGLTNDTVDLTCVAADEDDDFFVVNETTPERKEILALIHRMTAVDPAERCSLAEAIAETKNIRETYINTHPQDAQLKIGLLDLATLESLDEKEIIQFAEKMKGVKDQCILTNSLGMNINVKQFLTVKQILEKNNIFVSDKVYTGKSRMAVKNFIGKKYHDKADISFINNLNLRSTPAIK